MSDNPHRRICPNKGAFYDKRRHRLSQMGYKQPLSEIQRMFGEEK